LKEGYPKAGEGKREGFGSIRTLLKRPTA